MNRFDAFRFPLSVREFLEEQLRRFSNGDSGGIPTIGILGAIWSSSAAIALAVLVLPSFAVLVAGPTITV